MCSLPFFLFPFPPPLQNPKIALFLFLFLGKRFQLLAYTCFSRKRNFDWRGLVGGGGVGWLSLLEMGLFPNQVLHMGSIARSASELPCWIIPSAFVILAILSLSGNDGDRLSCCALVISVLPVRCVELGFIEILDGCKGKHHARLPPSSSLRGMSLVCRA